MAVCPEHREHLFCAACPCPIPPCAEGHGGKDGMEWRCENCTKSKCCPCWVSKVRKLAGWKEAHEEWLRQRNSRQAVVGRMMHRASRLQRGESTADMGASLPGGWVMNMWPLRHRVENTEGDLP